LAAGNANIPNNPNEIITTFKNAAANALNQAYPGKAGLKITEAKDGMLSYEYLTTSDSQLKAFQDVVKRAVIAVAKASGYVDAKGNPLSTSVSGALAAVLNPSIEVGSGAVVDAAPSNQPAPSNVPAAAAAAQSSVPARPAFQAQPPTATAQPVAQGGLATGAVAEMRKHIQDRVAKGEKEADVIAEVRKNALAKIAEGVDREVVRQRFREITGRDL
jgi:hypothetical protein